MSTPHRFFPRSPALAAAIAAALGAGCANLTRPYPVKDRFTLTAPAAQPTPGAQHAGTLRVERARVSPPFDAHAFVYRTGEVAYLTDYYNEFIAAPDQLLTTEAVRALAARAPFAIVLDPSGAADCAWRLETTVTDLYGDYRDPASPRAYVRARFMLLHDAPGTTEVAGEWTLEAADPLEKKGAPELAAAMGRAWGDILAHLDESLRHLPAPPSSPAPAPPK